MASTKSKRNQLPQRFQPFQAQAQTQGALRYGAQEAGLQSLFGETTDQYQRQSSAQDAAAKSLLGSLSSAGTGLNQVYSDAGLTPEVRAQYANTPDGQRILASLARGQGDIQAQTLGAQASRQYIQQRLGDDYRQDVGKINAQGQAMATERGLYESSLLDQLIGDDRAARSKVNADARQQTFDADQAIQQQNAAQTNALIGQGLLPGADGTLQPLPGGKADPNAPGNKPKRTTGAGTASPDKQNAAGTAFSRAAKLAAAAVKAAKAQGGGSLDAAQARGDIGTVLTEGSPAKQGKVVYEEVTVTDAYGTKKTVRRPKLEPDRLADGTPNPRAGEQVTSKSRPASPKFDAPIAAAATEQALFGYVTTKTVRELQKLGYSVNQIPGLKTENAARAARPKTSTPTSRPRNAPSGTPGQSRPT